MNDSASNSVQVLELSCSFCGKSSSEVDVMISGPAIYICCECVALCSELVEDQRKRRADTVAEMLAKASSPKSEAT